VPVMSRPRTMLDSRARQPRDGTTVMRYPIRAWELVQPASSGLVSCCAHQRLGAVRDGGV